MSLLKDILGLRSSILSLKQVGGDGEGVWLNLKAPLALHYLAIFKLEALNEPLYFAGRTSRSYRYTSR
jgi:hypothetical protein